MKILMLSWEYPPRVVGGIARVVHELSRKLAMQGHDVSVVTYREGDTPYEEIEDGVKVYRVDNYMIRPQNFIDWIMQLNFNMVAKVSELVNDGEKFDIIHSHDWLTCYAAKTLKHSFNIPLTATIHATEAGRNSGIRTEQQKYINDAEWLLTYEANQIIVNSNFMKSEALRLFNLDYSKVKIIPNGIDLDKFDGFDRDYSFRRNYASDNEKIIFTLGRIVNEKGIQHLICALPKIIEHYNDVKLVIGGKRPTLEELKALAYRLGVAHRVYFVGFLQGNDVQRMFKCADIAVFPSTYEPFGIVALEAMLSGIPTVVSDIGGLDEIVSHKVDGMKSYAGNANSIADSVLELLYNQDLKDKIVKNATRKVRELFNWNRIAKMSIDVYEEAIKNFNESVKEAEETIPEEIKVEKLQKESILERLTKEKDLLDRLARPKEKLSEA